MIECLVIVARQVDQVEVIAADGTLRFLQDVGSCHLSRSASFLHKASFIAEKGADELLQTFWTLSSRQQTLAVDLLKRLHRCCDTAAETDSEAPTAFVARFVSRVLRSIRTQSRAGSPAPGAPSTASLQGQEVSRSTLNDALTLFIDQPVVSSSIMTELDEFLESSATDASYSLMDEQYWYVLWTFSPLNVVVGLLC